ncbi:hypothetical protein EMIT0P228_40200 [Pseudomonas brassicacearum]
MGATVAEQGASERWACRSCRAKRGCDLSQTFEPQVKDQEIVRTRPEPSASPTAQSSGSKLPRHNESNTFLEVRPVLGRALKPRIHHPPIQLFPIRHAQYPSGVQPAQITAQLIGRGAPELRVGFGAAQQHAFVLDQVISHPLTEVGQYRVANQIKRSHGYTSSIFLGLQLLLGVIVTITKCKFCFADNHWKISAIEHATDYFIFRTPTHAPFIFASPGVFPVVAGRLCLGAERSDPDLADQQDTGPVR